jgi:mannose-6-phosphate isomerase
MKRARSSETLVSLLTFSSSAPSYGSYFRTLSALEELILKLYAVYKTDRGVFCPLIMNYLILSPGDAFFMGPNEPHAYISGDCIECMALSDNVVRAGLTPKFKDVDVLCDMLHYRYVECICCCDRRKPLCCDTSGAAFQNL